MAWRVMGVLILICGVLLSALGVVYAKHQSRTLFNKLQQIYKERDEMNVEWGRLQLEQNTWASHGRIERIVSEELNMGLPNPKSTVIIYP